METLMDIIDTNGSGQIDYT